MGWLQVLRSRDGLAAVGLLLAGGAVSCLVPVLRVVDYPLSLAASPLAALVMAVFGALGGRERPVWQRFLEGSLVLAAGTVALLVPPCLASLLTGVVCEPDYGLLFVLLGPAGSGLCGLTLGLAAGRLVRPRWLAIALCGAWFLGSVFIAVAEFYWTPLVRFYGSLFGLYHGAVYDEAVFVEAPYVWLRVWDGALIAVVLLLLGGVRGRRWRQAALVVAAGGLTALSAASPWLGFVASRVRVDEVLSGRLAGSGIEVRYQPGTRGEAVAAYLLRDLEFRAEQVRERFGLEVCGEPVRAYLYEGPGQKRRLMGAGRTSIAKPWLSELHIQTHDVGDPLIAHELAHVMLAEASDSFLGVPTMWLLLPRPGIVEGAAESVERGGSPLTAHQWAAAMKRIGKQPDLERLMESVGFWAENAALAYTAAGSFVRYLLEEYGPEPFRRVYGGAALCEAYGVPAAALLAGWNGMLDAIPLADGDLELARFVFLRPPVFGKVCPYAGGRCLERAGAAVRARDLPRAVALARVAYTMTDGDTQLALSLSGLLLAGGGYGDALDLIEAVRREKELGAVAAASFGLQAGDGWRLLGDDEEAVREYEALAVPAARRWLGAALAWREALALVPLPGEMLRVMAGAYIRRDEGALLDAAALSCRELPVTAQALVAVRMAADPRRYEEAWLLLGDALDGLPAEAHDLLFAAWLLRTKLSCLLGRGGAAGHALDKLVTMPLTAARQEWVQDWRERLVGGFCAAAPVP